MPWGGPLPDLPELGGHGSSSMGAIGSTVVSPLGFRLVCSTQEPGDATVNNPYQRSCPLVMPGMSTE